MANIQKLQELRRELNATYQSMSRIQEEKFIPGEYFSQLPRESYKEWISLRMKASRLIEELTRVSAENRAKA